MRCTHCGSADGSERLVRFRNRNDSRLILCGVCVQEFERDDSVLEVRFSLTQ